MRGVWGWKTRKSSMRGQSLARGRMISLLAPVTSTRQSGRVGEIGLVPAKNAGREAVGVPSKKPESMRKPWGWTTRRSGSSTQSLVGAQKTSPHLPTRPTGRSGLTGETGLARAGSVGETGVRSRKLESSRGGLGCGAGGHGANTLHPETGRRTFPLTPILSMRTSGAATATGLVRATHTSGIGDPLRRLGSTCAPWGSKASRNGRSGPPQANAQKTSPHPLGGSTRTNGKGQKTSSGLSGGPLKKPGSMCGL